MFVPAGYSSAALHASLNAALRKALPNSPESYTVEQIYAAAEAAATTALQQAAPAPQKGKAPIHITGFSIKITFKPFSITLGGSCC